MGLVKILSTENDDLRQHLNNCKDGKNKVSFLTNKFIDNVLFRVSEHLTQKIVKQIEEAGGRFGLCVDSTTDITTKHQTSIVVRYITKERNVAEHTVGFVESTDASGKATFAMVKDSLNKIGLNTRNVVGCSFDGAMNMRSSDAGVFHYLLSENCECVYCWCYAHRFNWCVEGAYKK